MMFRNSVRLLLANFSTVWKLLLYYAICFIITASICVPIVGPIIIKFTQVGIFSDLTNIFNNVFSEPTGVVPAFHAWFENLSNVFVSSVPELLWNYIGFAFIIIIFIPFVFGLAELAIGDTLYGFMTSQSYYGFSASFIKNLGKSALFQLTKILIILPVDLMIIAVFAGMIKVFSFGGIIGLMCGFLILVAMVIIISAKISFFAGWMPSIVSKDLNPFKALKVGVKAATKNYFKNFSNVIIFVLLSIVINVFFGIFSFGTALFLTVPMTIFAFAILSNVISFSSWGMRYYVYPDVFVSAKRMEEQDNINKTRYLL